VSSQDFRQELLKTWDKNFSRLGTSDFSSLKTSDFSRLGTSDFSRLGKTDFSRLGRSDFSRLVTRTSRDLGQELLKSWDE
jgi:hypothetical protein